MSRPLTPGGLAAIAAGICLTCTLATAADDPSPGSKSQPPSDAKARAQAKARGELIERGRYVVKLGGCNDCHTVGYGEASGQVPEAQWLTGVPVGWQGPWGTTYAANLRTYFQSMSADQWVKAARVLKSRPPMPWFTVAAMPESDLRAMYAFIHSLGPGGEPAPDYLPPGVEAKGPVVKFPAPPSK